MALTIHLQNNGALGGPHHTHHAFHQRAFSVAIGAQQRNRLTVVNRQAYAVQRLYRTITGADVVDC